MKSEEHVPIHTPRIMANAKLRMLLPPSTKIHRSTIKVLTEVLMVRGKVEFKDRKTNEITLMTPDEAVNKIIEISKKI